MSRVLAWAIVSIGTFIVILLGWVITSIKSGVGRGIRDEVEQNDTLYLPRIQRIYGEWVICTMKKQDDDTGIWHGNELESLETRDVVFAKQKAATLCGVSIDSVVVEL